MAEAPPLSDLPRGRGFLPHEMAFVLLAAGTFLAVWGRAGSLPGVALEAGLATVLYGAAVLALGTGREPLQKIRLLASFGFVLWFYRATARIVPALAVPTRDDVLYQIDRTLFRETPAVLCQSFLVPWLTDLLSVCYLSFHVYLTVAVVHLLWRPLDAGIRLSVYLFATYAVGFLGYLLVPAVGPWKAFPQLFPTALTGGGLTTLNAWVVAQGSSVYDVFPSLHVLVTLVLLDHDWREVRCRFWIALPPAVGLVFATVYLRYHYAVDLLAGGGLFLILRWTLRRWTTCPQRKAVI